MEQEQMELKEQEKPNKQEEQPLTEEELRSLRLGENSSLAMSASRDEAEPAKGQEMTGQERRRREQERQEQLHRQERVQKDIERTRDMQIKDMRKRREYLELVVALRELEDKVYSHDEVVRQIRLGTVIDTAKYFGHSDAEISTALKDLGLVVKPEQKEPEK